MSELLRMDEPRKRFAAMISGLHVHYDLGEGRPLLGRRMPDLELVTDNGPLRVFTLLHDARPLLNFGEPGGLDITPWADRVQSIDAEYAGCGSSPVPGAVTAPSAVLIRPDGYVVWVGDGAHLKLPEPLTTWFGPPHGRPASVRSREWQRTEVSYGARNTDWIVVAAVAMTDRPLGAQIDAVLERLHAHGRGNAGIAIREVLDEYADALTGDMRSTAFRETDRGAEILILGSGRISLISVDFDESIVRFETRGLHGAVVSLETTDLKIPDGTPVSAKRRWRFKFPDGSALAIDGTLTQGRCDNLDRFAADVMSEVGVQESVRDQEPHGEQRPNADASQRTGWRRQPVTDLWGNPSTKAKRRNR
jgi:hypothetical protein